MFGATPKHGYIPLRSCTQRLLEDRTPIPKIQALAAIKKWEAVFSLKSLLSGNLTKFAVADLVPLFGFTPCAQFFSSPFGVKNLMATLQSGRRASLRKDV